MSRRRCLRFVRDARERRGARIAHPAPLRCCHVLFTGGWRIGAIHRGGVVGWGGSAAGTPRISAPVTQNVETLASENAVAAVNKVLARLQPRT